MPENDDTPRGLAERYLSINKDWLTPVKFPQPSIVSRINVGSSAVEALSRSFRLPMVEAFAAQNRFLTSPAMDALAAQRQIITGPAMEALTRSIFANLEPFGVSKMYAEATRSAFLTPGVQQMISQVTARSASQVLAGYPGLHRSILDMSQQFQELKDAEEAEGYGEAENGAAVSEAMLHRVDEQSFDHAWNDIERVLRSDRQLRRSVKSGARQLSKQAKIGRKPAVRIVMAMIIVWLCAVSIPWMDGEQKMDDVAVPVGLLAAEYLAYLKADPAGSKNILQKNGPRRRRHRRKNRRRGNH